MRATGEVELEAPRATSERVIGWLLLGCGLLSIFTTGGIALVLVTEALGFFAHVSLADFLGDTQWTPLFADKHFGIWPLLAGTLLTTAIAIAIAVPFGLLAAIYLSEFASERARRALSAGIVMGIMVLPIIASLSEDAIYAVPPSLREGAFALGATKVNTVLRVVVPSAFSGIAASVILGVSRAIGETMIVAIAAGQEPRLTLDPRVPVETMTAYIVQVSLGDTPTGTLEYQTIFAVGLTLFSMTLLMNVISHRLRKRVLMGGAL